MTLFLKSIVRDFVTGVFRSLVIISNMYKSACQQWLAFILGNIHKYQHV